ncbi:TIGR03564 family F420-dependent LLM class oxidoreductase [Mycolicibacterium sp.]|jgi:F420-dependent oxidoreductase-like protein|uniref:TIGR03564 family F420-dependent LLM class oxidoreductase n=1 Tax=Mycolicibacterium sp. TaxID=2320850 RepID=UPI001A241FD1|nr:TIGR03564 family F420-dependent LLM class oxidoreductase [Mycolicibacterium sp.]MBJ7401080.1 TIGR03564 family F420-dependent LLM class oxidoreductase [Mycolicibacterium sp.]
MELGIFSTAVNDGTLDDIVAEAAAVERDGFAAFWVPNIFGHDALTVLAVVGTKVPRIELGTAVVPTFPRHPHAMAQQAHTVAAASGGRFTLGIGLSHKIVVENMFGLSYDKPVRHLREYLSVLMPLSRNQFANFDGEMYKVHAAISAKGSDGFSVVVAALGEQMLRVTAAMADGTLTWCTGPVTLANHIVPTITKAADEFSRPAPRVIAALPVCVTDDRADAAARAAQTFAAYGGLPSYRAMLDREGVAGPADIAIIGSAAEVQDRVGALAGIGVTDFAAVEFGATPDEVRNTREALKGLLGGK